MKSSQRELLGIIFSLIVLNAGAAVRYVDVNSANPASPYTSWATAANNIQDAVDMAVAGDEILVTNGIYQTGARAVVVFGFGVSNRVAVTKPVTVRSVNGPAVTQIRGYQVPGTIHGRAAIRCVYLANGATLEGFTLTNGATETSGDINRDQCGGGVWCEGSSAVLSNCTLTGNAAYYGGGGAYNGTLNNCMLTGNSARYFDGGGARDSTLNNCTLMSNSAGNDGGGAIGGTLNNCTLTGNSAGNGGGTCNSTLNNCALTGNSADYGGGALGGVLNNCTLTGNSAANFGGGTYGGTLTNCIVYYNSARLSGNNYSGSTLNYCCTTPLPTSGTGNISAEPQLASVSRLSASSPCGGAGSAAYATGVDVDGEPWANPPSMGCDEYWSGSLSGALNAAIVAAYTNVAVGFEVNFQAVIEGRVSASRWNFGDGNVASNRPYASHAWVVAGDYVVELRAYNESYPDGVAAAVTVHVVQGEHYVALNGTNPVPPYSSWATAATNIQDAVEVAVPGALVLVTNGVYQTGAREVYGMSNRLAVTKPMTVRSVNGPAVTQIMGYRVTGTTNGAGAVRCVYLTNGAVLAGFTLTNGATQNSGDSIRNQSGGGVWCDGSSAVVSNCVFTGNSARRYGGGALGGTLNNSTLTRNSADYGGGTYDSTLNMCMLIDNAAYYDGGGNYNGTLNNCTLAGNTADRGGGTYMGTLNNCIIFYNKRRPPSNSIANYVGGTFNYCCTTPLPAGPGNLINAPSFVNTNGWSDLRLRTNSPCINAGNNAFASGPTDLDGNARIAGGTVDIGAYEFQTPASAISYAWLQRYGLPTDGTADFADMDGEGMNNWQEWRAGTVPTNALSALRMLSPTGSASGITLSWESVNTRNYWLERASGLSTQPAFSIIAANLPGKPVTTTYTDTNATDTGQFFYRVGVQPSMRETGVESVSIFRPCGLFPTSRWPTHR